jgi:putative membrane protein
MMGGFGSGFGSGFGGFGGFGLIGMLFNLVFTVGFLVLLVVLAVWLWRRFNVSSYVAAPRAQAGPAGSAKEILQGRYARGEIAREQYQQMLADLV